MNSYLDALLELKARCARIVLYSQDERSLLHNAYWNGNSSESAVALELIVFEPDPMDLPILLDASSPSSWHILRIYAAEALGRLPAEGINILRLNLEREKHPLVRFYIQRELIDLEDESVAGLLDGPIPPNGSPGRRSLWIYGNFQRESLSRDKALKYMSVLLADKLGRHNWLRDHIG